MLITFLIKHLRLDNLKARFISRSPKIKTSVMHDSITI